MGEKKNEWSQAQKITYQFMSNTLKYTPFYTKRNTLTSYFGLECMLPLEQQAAKHARTTIFAFHLFSWKRNFTLDFFQLVKTGTW